MLEWTQSPDLRAAGVDVAVRGAARLSGRDAVEASTEPLAEVAVAAIPSPRRQIPAKGVAPSDDWQRTYVRRLALLDGGCALAAAALALVVRFGQEATTWELALHCLLGVLLIPSWLIVLTFLRAYERRFLGVGSEEFRRVLLAGLVTSAGVSTVSFAFHLEIARGFVLVGLPLLTVFTLIGRYLVRCDLHAARSRGERVQRTLVVGPGDEVASMTRTIRSAAYHGLAVVGACVPLRDSDQDLAAIGVRVVGTLQDVVACVRQHDVDVVAVLPNGAFRGPELRRLGWDLEATGAELLIAPGAMEMIGPRVAIRPVCGLPLLHLERPELVGVRRFAKGMADRGVAFLALLVLAPLLAVIAVAVALTSPGGVVFRQARVGRDGKTFTLFKFRTMTRNAEGMVCQLKARDEGNGVLFKIRGDPRITRVGSVLRRSSLDELPQLVNVLWGDMSLVGPRPPLVSEVERYGGDMRRRLMVKPGLTGLWQVNGRSDLDWEESVRLDLRYVENWSFAFDLMIIWKTLGAVVTGRGAY